MRTVFVLPHNPISMIAFIVFLSRGVRMVLYEVQKLQRSSKAKCRSLYCCLLLLVGQHLNGVSVSLARLCRIMPYS